MACLSGDGSRGAFLCGKVAFSSYAIPRKLSWSDKADFFSEATGSGKALKIQKTIDFHTVMGTVKADGGKESNAVLTYRQYLSDVTFLVLLEGDAAFLRRLAAALEDPVWGVWLGRKSCIPSEPVFGGLFANQKSAVDSLIGENWLIREEEVGAFAEGSVVQKDIPVGFDPRKRTHGVRRVRREYRRE